MRKYLSVLSVLIILLVGCSKKEKTAIVIGDIKITSSEFEEAFQSSSFAHKKDAGRAMFLDSFISKKLILNEAEKLGLDRDKELLKDIQSFWEQALLKLVLAQKSKDFAELVRVSDEEINSYYKTKKETDFAAQELPQVYAQIKWILSQRKQSEAMSQWIDALKANTNIIVDPQILSIK